MVVVLTMGLPNLFPNFDLYKELPALESGQLLNTSDLWRRTGGVHVVLVVWGSQAACFSTKVQCFWLIRGCQIETPKGFRLTLKPIGNITKV